MTHPDWLPNPLPGRAKIDEQSLGVSVGSYEPPLEVVDGDLTVRVWWSAEDDAWVANLHDAKQGERTVHYSPTSHGETKADALAHLAFATYVGLIDDAT